MSVASDVAGVLIRDFLLKTPGHEGTAPGAWLCGECPYMNVGSRCTKCGAWAGSAAS